jgi:hypothetical protein
MELRGSPAHPRPPASARLGCRCVAGALAAASLLLAACGSDSPPPSDGGGTQLPGGTPGSGSSSIPTGCTNDVATSSLPAFMQGDASGTKVQSLGVHSVGETVPFTVPEGSVSFTIVEQAVDAPLSLTVTSGGSTYTLANTAVPLKVLDPGGHAFYDDLASLPSDLSTSDSAVVFLSDSPGTGTLTAPNTHAGLESVDPVAGGGFPAGTWSLQVSDWAYECATVTAYGCSESGARSSTYDVTVITKTADGHAIPSAGTIDVAIYLATSSAPDDKGTAIALDAATANGGGDKDLNRMVDTMKGIFARAGITMNGPTYYDLPDAQTTYATGVNVDLSGACSPLAQLLKNAKPGNTLNIFLVSRLTSSDGNTVGIDGTIPGPASIGGTVASGAAVSAEDLRTNGGTAVCTGGTPRYTACGADAVAYAIAHEAGHFMGLYHTTERSGLDFDPLTDTAECQCASCATLAAGESCGPASGKTAHDMSGSECASPTAKTGCGGADDLMFWSLGPGAAGLLTDEQARVMRANPLVH